MQVEPMQGALRDVLYLLCCLVGPSHASGTHAGGFT